MKKYENYKDSGLEWLGMVPEHWKIMKMKYICNVTDGTHFSPATISEGKPYITVSNVKDDFIDIESAGRISIADFNELVKQGCQPKTGDVLLAKDGTVGRSAIVKDNDYVVLSSLGILSPNDNLTSSYLKYMLDSSTLQEQMNEAMAGSALRRITITKIKDFIILLPPTSEQRTIASYLDQKVGQIDALISEKGKMVEDLKAYRSSLITETVTKGLDKEVEMKDSGVEWIGKMPKDWKLLKLKRIVNLKSGTTLTSDRILDEGKYQVFGGNGPRGYIDDYTNEGNFVLIGRQGALCGNINYANGKFWATEHAIICYPLKDIDTIWLGETLRAMNLNQYSISAAQPGLAVERINELLIPTPSISEQKEISSYLKLRIIQIESAISEQEHQLSDLKSYKSSLITEAVTGKIDLRDWQTKKT